MSRGGKLARRDKETVCHPDPSLICICPAQALQAEVVIQPFGPADRTDFPAWQVQNPAQKEALDKKRGEFPAAPAIVYPLAVGGDGILRTHSLELSRNPNYRGGMKQLLLRFPPADGTAEVRRIAFHR